MGSSEEEAKKKLDQTRMRQELELHKARSQAMEEAEAIAVRGTRPPSRVLVKDSDELLNIRKDYEEFVKAKKYTAKDWWGNAQKDMDAKSNLFYFETEEDAGAFFLEQARKGRKFEVVDADSGKLLFRSDGKKLTLPNGKEYTGGKFLPEAEEDADRPGISPRS